jgi:hypothetical protein
MIPIRLERIPRPERSGIVSVLVCYVALCGYFDLIWPPLGSGHFTFGSVLCWLMPWDCPQDEPQIQTKEYRVTPIFYQRGSGPCTKDCGHFDFRWAYADSGQFKDYFEHTPYTTWPCFDGENEIVEKPKTWTDVKSLCPEQVSFIYFDGGKNVEVKQQIKWHNDPLKEKKP